MAESIVFWFLIALPGVRPLEYESPVQNIAECVGLVASVLVRPRDGILSGGAVIRAGCVVTIPRAENP